MIAKSARCASVLPCLIAWTGTFAFLGSAANAAPALLAHATDLGTVDPSIPVQITVWLKMRNDDALQDEGSSRHGGAARVLSDEQVEERHAPRKADVAKVSGFLKSRGLSVTEVGPHNFFVKATGSAAVVDSAFAVQLHRYSFRGSTFRASQARPALPDAIAPLVVSVGGLSDLGAKPNAIRASSPANIGPSRNIARTADAEGMKPKVYPLSAGAAGLIFATQCFYPSTTISFTGDGASATYTGKRYGASIDNTAPGTIAPCAYQPSDLQTAYHLKSAYKAGFDGKGETIAIVDAYGSTTIANDLAVFSEVMGLPPAKLSIVGKATESGFSGDANSGWADETTLDVEWVHAIAPGAKIVLVIAPTNSFDDLFAAIAKATTIHGVVAISNSWAGPESETDVPTRTAGDELLRIADARGQGANFATGDSGNETIDLGYVDVNYPASSPNATAIGGVSVGLNANKQIDFQSSWGNNITELFDTIALGSPPIDPPFNEGFIYGGGGGDSNVYPLPWFQTKLGGVRRKLPDISWVADPYTGVEIIETLDAQGDQYFEGIGGTSLATPMFSALWGIATQRAGHPLGQAAAYLYTLPPYAIMDVEAAPMSAENVHGELTDSSGKQIQTTWDLALPLQGQPTFVSTLYNSPSSTRWFVLTFGTDSTLPAGPGWDPATGLGTPNAWNFIQSFEYR
jgi:subtilase family serine protease